MESARPAALVKPLSQVPAPERRLETRTLSQRNQAAIRMAMAYMANSSIIDLISRVAPFILPIIS